MFSSSLLLFFPLLFKRFIVFPSFPPFSYEGFSEIYFFITIKSSEILAFLVFEPLLFVGNCKEWWVLTSSSGKPEGRVVTLYFGLRAGNGSSIKVYAHLPCSHCSVVTQNTQIG